MNFLDNSFVKKEYKNMLIESGIEQAFLKLKIDFYNVFLPDIKSADTNPYEDYSWEAKSNSMEGLREGLVIHAVPPLLKIETFPWEEWYVHKNKTYHAILFTTKKEKNDGEVIIKSDDLEHPECVKGKKWYFFLDNNLKPFLLKTRLK